jgi:hypothetical protein
MSSFKAEYQVFFESPAGMEYKQHLIDQRASEHDKAENNPEQARDHASTAKAYTETLNHIESIQMGVIKPSRSSNGADA